MSLRSAVSIVVVGCLMVALLWERTAGFSAWTYETLRRVEVARHPVPVSDWSLQDARGELVQLSDWSDEVLLVGFIFTRCTSVCVALGTRYRQLQHVLEADRSTRVHLLSVSIDPSHDTPGRLADYQRRHGGKQAFWTVARPTDEQTLSTLIRETGLRVIPDPVSGFSHSDSLHWIQDGQLVRISAWTDPALEDLLRNGG